MSDSGALSPRTAPSQRSLVVIVVGALVVFAIAATGLAWAKWFPYASKVGTLHLTREWDGASMLTSSDGAPSLTAAWDFAAAYTKAVWRALLVSLLIAAALDALVSRRWLVRLLSRGSTWGQAGTGAVLSLPSMMCTCCTAPITVTLRRSGAPTAAVVSHWLGNPLLNPAVLVFLFLVAPWQWGVARLAVGIVVVITAAVITGEIARRRAGASPTQVMTPRAATDEPTPALSELPGRFLRSLWRISRVLVPEYAIVVLIVGGFSGWLARFTEITGTGGVAALVLAAVVGTLLVIPTGGEIPVLIGLSAVGASSGLLGVLLITLPALSVPSMVMVARALSVRVTMAAAITVAGGGLLAAGVLTTMS
ncbi:MAG TPA: permease [Nocardioidaceae bacterium]|nr:permease [Nocardioidaceae bacterium]